MGRISCRSALTSKLISNPPVPCLPAQYDRNTRFNPPKRTSGYAGSPVSSATEKPAEAPAPSEKPVEVAEAEEEP